MRQTVSKKSKENEDMDRYIKRIQSKLKRNNVIKSMGEIRPVFDSSVKVRWNPTPEEMEMVYSHFLDGSKDSEGEEERGTGRSELSCVEVTNEEMIILNNGDEEKTEDEESDTEIWIHDDEDDKDGDVSDGEETSSQLVITPETKEAMVRMQVEIKGIELHEEEILNVASLVKDSYDTYESAIEDIRNLFIQKLHQRKKEVENFLMDSLSEVHALASSNHEELALKTKIGFDTLGEVMKSNTESFRQSVTEFKNRFNAI